MPIIATDIKFRLSGGAANSDPNAALGGAMSSVAIVDATLHNLFDIVASAEASAGDAEYRCFYVLNNHATLTLQNAVVFVQTESGSADTDELIGLGSAAIDVAEQTVVDESTAPTSVTFSQANGEGSALSIGNLGPGSFKSVWIRRDISVAAAAVTNDTSVIRVKGDTAA